MSELARQVLNPDVVKTWPARAFPDRDPSNKKEMADNVENGRSILSTVLNASPADVSPTNECLSGPRILYDAQMSLP